MRAQSAVLPLGGVQRSGWSVVIVGLGNIGGALVGLIARIAGVERIVLIDPDSYESENLSSQSIAASAIGQAKATYQARCVTAINPAINVVPLVARAEDVPAGMLRADLVLGCLDSRAARRTVSEIVWALGGTYIDAGVNPAEMLARADVYVPGEDRPCFQCPLGDARDERSSDVQSCTGASPAPAATGGSAGLGHLAASMQAIEAEKVLNGDLERALVGRQVVLNARWHRHYVNQLRRSPSCRFSHDVWQIGRLDESPAQLTIGAAIDLGGAGAAAMSVPYNKLVIASSCLRCGSRLPAFRLSRRLHPGQRACESCGEPMVSIGKDAADRLGRRKLSPTSLRRTLQNIGMRPFDVFTVHRPEGDLHFELGVPSPVVGVRRSAR